MVKTSRIHLAYGVYYHHYQTCTAVQVQSIVSHYRIAGVPYVFFVSP